jgi:hypothetical protein
MTDKKITDLTNITGADLVDADEFVVVDISADETKAITLSELKEAFDSGTGFVRITGDTMTGDLSVPNVVVSGNVDGRDVSSDGTKLDGIEAGADVTDTYNVTAAGALMDSEVTNLAQVKAFDETDYVAVTGDSMTGNLSFGDNDKAIFGAGSDLSIYHNSANNKSYIEESGTGNLVIRGSDIDILAGNGEAAINVAQDGAVTLYNDNNAKLATTSSGCDITGTLTSDGLTVDTQLDNSSKLTLGSTANVKGEITYDTDGATTFNFDNQYTNSTAYFNFRTNTSSTPKTHLTIAGSGNISFYEDTGTTAKFFWDASAEGLSIRTTSNPNNSPLYIRCATDDNIRIQQETHAAIQAVNDAANAFTELKLDGSTLLLNSQSGGNVGIGCVPNSIQSGFDTLQIGGNLTLNVDSTGVGAGVYMGNNVYRDSGNSRWEYINTDEATQYIQANGEHIWRYAASGSANAAISWSEAMRIDSSGRVGIGTSLPDNSLHVSYANSTAYSDVTGDFGIQIENTDTTTNSFSQLHFRTGNSDSYIRSIREGDNLASLAFLTDDGGATNDVGEAMRIDSSGNLLVGKTSTSSTTAGGNIFGGLGSFVRDGNTPLSLNRRTNDGEIISFAGQDNVVGNIGVANGDNLYISSDDTNDVGVKFNGDGNRITPCDASGADRNGAIDLGEGSARFKDLYLSGGVYLGGTGSANKLDDYEEGTWTPSVSSGFTLDSTQTAVYRKIGDVVHVFGSITVDVTNGTEAILAGLPFNCGAGNEPVIITFNNGSTLQYIPRARTDSSQPKLKFNPQVTASNVQIMIQATYRAS